MIAKTKMCKTWEHVPNRGEGLAHSQVQTWEHFVRGGGLAKCSQSQIKNAFYYNPNKT